MRIALVSPTMVTFAERVSRVAGHDVFVKHDNATHPRYGGNKARKLEYLLADAREHRATDLITMGAVGSHHVLATTVHGISHGFRVEAVLSPQPATPHVERTLRAVLAQGATLHAALHAWELPARVAARLVALGGQGRMPYLIPPGGSTPLGACGYVDAVAELKQQLGSLGIPSPDVMVCALGSGGTLAGLLGGARLHDLRAAVWGVRVTPRWMCPRRYVAYLAGKALALVDPRGVAYHPHFQPEDVPVSNSQLGPGYGRPTRAAQEALDLFGLDGVELDLTYTAKAAAGLLAMARSDVSRNRYLFWNTLSSAPLDSLIHDPSLEIPAHLRALLR